MVQHILFKILMIPFALLYGLGVQIHNGLYKLGILRGLEFSLPVISIGNMTVGGAGKTPHVEYLTQKLNPFVKVAILSRGYRRKTKGLKYVSTRSTAFDVGDEPLQFKRKFPDTTIVVSESRAFAIPQMVARHPDLQVVLLDDAFQHRAVDPSLNILLTEYQAPFFKDHLLPVGRLREWKSAYKRADVIMVSKCPPSLTNDQRGTFIEKLNPEQDQSVFFTKYQYHNPYFIFNPSHRIRLTDDIHVVLVCALAGTAYLIDFLHNTVQSYDTIEYEDHHYYNIEDLNKVQQTLSLSNNPKKIILTTEKDATRLELLYPTIKEYKLPIFVLPISVQFLDDDESKFDRLIKQHLLAFEV